MKRFFVFLVILLTLACTSQPQHHTLQIAANPADLERLAAKEICRYVRLCSGETMIIAAGETAAPEIILSVQDRPLDLALFSTFPDLPKEQLSEQSYAIHTVSQDNHKQVIIRGGSPVGLLYGAYRFIESLGVRFYLHDDVLPEKSPFVLPDLQLVETPQFELRGVQPFHDFPEGPDWWNRDDYKAVMTQLVKMRMNFIGFHTYPATPFGGWFKPEPMVWHGTVDQIKADGQVKAAYPVLHFHTGDSTWAYDPMPTSEYAFGASQLFDVDNFGADYMKNFSPWPHTEAENLHIFNEFGELQKDAFTFAHRLGVKTCIGTETPLNIPASVHAQLKAQGIDPMGEEATQKVYEGTFERIKRLFPLDYYWFWTPEYWTWQDVPDADVARTERDMLLAAEAAQRIGAEFTLATCGWVLGPPKDRAQFDRTLPKEMPFSCINREVGFTPVDGNFARITERPTWAVSWLEDDPALISPQLWVGRVRRDAVDALAYGCVGFMGIHWRTENLSPALSAVAQAGWSFGEKEQIDPATRDLPVKDFYRDWATANFGQEAGAEIATVFSRLDGGPLFIPGKNQRYANLYRTSDWAGKGPGGILINPAPWEEVRKQFEFIGELERVRGKILGAAQRERFDYWLNTFRYDRTAAHVGCLLGELETLAKTIAGEKDNNHQAQLAREQALPLKARIEKEWGDMVTLLLATVNTPGAIGTVANLEQHNLLNLSRISKYDSLLTTVLGELPSSAFWKEYRGQARLIVPTRRTILENGEPLRLQVIVLSAAPANMVTLHWRPMTKKYFRNKEFDHVARGVFRIQLSASEYAGDFEYFIESTADGSRLRFPAAPETNQSVIVW